MNYYKAFLFSLLVHGTSAFGLFIASKYLGVQTASLSPTELQVDLLIETPVAEKVVIPEKKKLNKPTASKEATTQETSSLAGEGHPSAKMNIIPDPNNPAPGYPEAARKKHLEGEVVVELTVNQAGEVVDLKLMETQADPILCERAIETLRKWKFIISNPNVTPIKIQVPVKFNLH
jgi:TonB family protein